MKPILFKIGSLNIYAYGLMMVIGFFVILYYSRRNADKAHMSKDDILDLTILTFISGIIGARVLYILVNFSEYSRDWLQVFQFQKGGLAWHGGLLGAFICIFLYTRMKKIDLWPTIDLYFTAAPLALAVGRIGCFLNGCCFGNPTDLPWAVTFPSHRHPQPVHPTQIYELLLDLVLFAFLYRWWNKRKFDGENTLLSFALYSVVRFIVEFFRNTSPDQMIHGLSLAQWVSLGMFIVLGGVVVVMRMKAVGVREQRLQPEASGNPAASLAATQNPNPAADAEG